VLDESSLASTKNLHKFFARLEAQDKVLLVGDTRQHQAVRSRNTLRNSFKSTEWQPVQLSEIVRQRKPELRRTVEKRSARKCAEAIDGLERQGGSWKIAGYEQRVKAHSRCLLRKPGEYARCFAA